MSDAEDTAAVPTTPEVEAEVLAIDDVLQPEDVSADKPLADIANPSTEQIENQSNALSNNEDVEIPENSNQDDEDMKAPKKQGDESDKTEKKKVQSCPPPQSRCKPRSRDVRQCKKHFREMIGKHEIRNDELEQRETDLRQRLEMLECSMPAVMVWNIWRMAQGAPVSHLRDIVEKQFFEPAQGSFAACPSTPSQHWDCRVREVEAERKQALHRTEEARKVFAVKGDTLKSQKQQIEEARRLQEERKIQIAKLEDEVKQLQDALKKAQGDENSCETGECGEIQCRKMWLQGVSSVSSIHSTDLECLARLQDLAEAELCMKRQIADLERRECAYMRTLQQADEMWAKMEDDNASNLGNLKEQLDAKIAANQQLADRIVELEDQIEKLRAHLTKALATLDEHESKTFADIGFGDFDVSTEEKIEQTEIEPAKTEVPEESKREDFMVEEESKLPIGGDEKPGETVQQEDTNMTSTPIEDKTSIPKVTKGETHDSEVEAARPHHEAIQVPTTTSTTEKSVQAKPKSKEAEAQSVAISPEPEEETPTEERAKVEPATITEVIGNEGMLAVPKIGPEVSKKPSSEREQGTLTAPEKALKTEMKHVDERLVVSDGRRPVADKASSVELLKVPTEKKSTGVSPAAQTEDNSSNKNEVLQIAPKAVAEPPSKIAAAPSNEKTFDTTVKTTSRLADEVVTKTTPKPAYDPVAKVSIEAAPEPRLPIDTFSKPVVETTPITNPKPLEEIVPQVVSGVNPVVSPVSTVADVSGSVLEPSTKPVIDSTQISSAKPVVKAVTGPVLELETEMRESVQIKSSANTFELPIETLVSWHNVIACLHKQILTCSRCSSKSGEVEKMLEKIRTYLGKDAPDLRGIECANIVEEVQNTVISPPNKKGPCICKPKSCPLDGTPAAIPAQANVQIQTVVDGQSQTSMPVKIPSRETRSSKSSKGSTKSKEEIKLMRIEEGTEPDSEMRLAKSIPEARDEATVTVGDIASQTEAIRSVGNVSENEEKPCVCPTGVCPKKQIKTTRGECSTGKICTSSKKPLGKKYRSTAEAILAPAITALPSNEYASGPPNSNLKADDMSSTSITSACCVCGKPLTPVASRKITSIPMPTKSVFKSKVMMASEGSNDDFLCCACRAKDSASSKPTYPSASKSFQKPLDVVKSSNRAKPVSETEKTSCSREVCCSCDKQEIHVLTKTLTTDLEVSKSKTKPETKDVCCLAKISRDKNLKTEARRRKDKESMKAATPSASSSSSTYKGSRMNDSSSSNVCCSNIEQVTDITKKKGKGSKCACDGQEGRSNKQNCVCGEDNEPIGPKLEKRMEPSVSCLCPPKLFDKC